jgi:hypothetical protein
MTRGENDTNDDADQRDRDSGPLEEIRTLLLILLVVILAVVFAGIFAAANY